MVSGPSHTRERPGAAIRSTGLQTVKSVPTVVVYCWYGSCGGRRRACCVHLPFKHTTHPTHTWSGECGCGGGCGGGNGCMGAPSTRGAIFMDLHQISCAVTTIQSAWKFCIRWASFNGFYISVDLTETSTDMCIQRTYKPTDFDFKFYRLKARSNIAPVSSYRTNFGFDTIAHCRRAFRRGVGGSRLRGGYCGSGLRLRKRHRGAGVYAR